ncbi:MAG: outer membrane beta-barrel protein [Prevotella sp.]|nr:outer membrane beta-barrel protein [Prevotella sp.]
MKQDKWAERLRNHMENYREEPKRDLWADIEATLDKQQVTPKPTMMVSLRRYVVAAAVVGLLLGGAYMLWENIETGKQSTELAQQATPENGNIQTAHNDSNEHSESTIEDMAVPAAKATSIAATSTERKLMAQATGYETATEAQEVTEPKAAQSTEESAKQTIEKEQTTKAPEDKESLREQDKKHTLPRVCELERQKQHSHARKSTMNLYASASSGGYDNTNGVMMSPSTLSNFAMSRGEVAYLVGYEEHQSHDQPFTIGITLSYPLSDRLSVSSGVAYTKLHSDFTSVMRSLEVKRHQVLHYVGVPLNMQLQLWQWDRLNIYVSAGGQVDFNVKATAETDGIEQEIDKDRPQWSIGGHLGVQYNIIPQLGVYAEPGVRHYFDNGSNVSNFFKDKPTAMSLQLGMRYNL